MKKAEKENKNLTENEAQKPLEPKEKPRIFDVKVHRDMVETCIMVDGSKYTGQFVKGTQVKDGIGQMIYPDGSTFRRNIY